MYLLRELQKYIKPTRIAKIKDWSSNVGDNVDQLELFLYIADEYVKCYKTVWQLLKKLNIHTTLPSHFTPRSPFKKDLYIKVNSGYIYNSPKSEITQSWHMVVYSILI